MAWPSVTAPHRVDRIPKINYKAANESARHIEGCLPGKELLERRPLLRIHEALADIAGLLLEPVRLVGVQQFGDHHAFASNCRAPSYATTKERERAEFRWVGQFAGPTARPSRAGQFVPTAQVP